MPQNDFLTFAGDPAANVMTQAQYIDAGFTARILGFATGTALSVELNKVWRQASLISTMIAQFTCDQTAQDMLDDGTPGGLSALETHFTSAVAHVAQGAVGTGYLPLVGGTLTGPLQINAAAPQLQINAPLGSYASINLTRQAGQAAQIAGYTGASARWTTLLGDTAPEQGSNSGSNFDIISFADGGGYLDTPLSINRATGVVNFSHSPTVNGALLPYVPLAGGVMTGTLGVGGTGVAFPGLGSYWGQHHIGLGWDGSNLQAAVDGTSIGALALQAWTLSLAGNYLPLAGGALSGPLTIHSTLVVDSTIFCRSTVYFSNLGDFSNFYDGRYRYRQWAGNWYDAWDGQTGTRTWACNGQWMSLDYSGSLSTSGTMRANGGRILSINGGFAPSIGCYWTGGVAKGMWVDGSGLWLGQMDGNASPTRADALFDNSGYVTIYGNGQCNGNWWVGGQITGNSNLYVVGSATLAGYTHVGGSGIQNDGPLTNNGTGYFGGQLTSNSTFVCNANASVAGTLWVNTNLSVANGAYINYVAAGNTDISGYLHTSGGRIVCSSSSQPSCMCWSTGGSNAMGFYVDSNGMGQGHGDGSGNPSQELTRLNSSVFTSAVPFYAPSDAALKQNIREADRFDSVAAICRTPVMAFDWKRSGRHVAHGLVAQHLQETMPDVLTDGEGDAFKDLRFVEPMALIAHLFRAIQQLNAKIEGRARA